MWGQPAAWRRGALAAGVLGLALLGQLPTFDRSVVPVDEGQLLAVAERLLHGERLYRDVYTGIFPGVYWLAAGLFAALGPDAVVTRWAQAWVNAATAAALFLLARRGARPAFAALAPLLYGVLVVVDFPGLSMLNYSPLSLAFALFALLALLAYVESGRTAQGVAAGLLLCACGLVKQNFGGLALAALAAGFAWVRPQAEVGRKSLGAGLWPLAAGVAAAAVAALSALAATGSLADFFEQTLFAIHRSQLEAFNDPLPPILGAHPADDPRFVFVYTPAALWNYLVRGEEIFGLAPTPALRGAAIRLAYGGVLAAVCGGLWLAWRERRAPASPRQRATRVLALFAAVFFLGIFPSAIWSHLAFVTPPVLVVLALVCDRIDLRLRALAPAPAHVWRGLVLGAALAAALLSVRISLDVRRWYPVPLGLARASLFVDAHQRAQLGQAARFLTRCAKPDEPVFVAPDQPLLYFLADRRNPTPYDLVIPGEVDGDRIVARLEATGTRCVVYNPKMYLQFAPFEELFPQVAGHLRGSYRRVARFGEPGREWFGLVRVRDGG
jgi:hypothetical protein